MWSMAQCRNVRAGTPVISCTVRVTGSGWVTSRAQVASALSANAGSPHYWTLSLGHTKEEVVKAGGATLADNYQTVTGKNTAYADLTAAVQAVTVTSDNPFGASGG